MNLPSIRLCVAALLVSTLGLAVVQRSHLWYPSIAIRAQKATVPIGLDFLFDARPTLSDCETITGRIARLVLAQCKSCEIVRAECAPSIDEVGRQVLGTVPLPLPAGRMANGVVRFQADDPDTAMAVCRQTEQATQGAPNPVTCQPPNKLRPPLDPHPAWSGLHALVLLLACAAAALVGWLILRYEHLHAHLSHDGVASGPQKVHTHPTPRVGGLAVLAGLLVAVGVTLVAGEGPLDREFGLLLVTAVPAFLGGLVEDLTKRVGVLERLMLTMLAGALASLVMGAALGRLDMPWVDQALAWLPASVVFTAFAVGGITNAINIIDGYNGLASGFSIIVLMAIAVVANQFGDSLILCTALALAGALAGFMIWNWPHGRMFLGDGGAYLTGFLLAELAVLLVQRHEEVSAWFPLLLMVYPVFETLYSVYRRRAQNGSSPGEPDNQHLHQMIHAWMLARAGATRRSTDAIAMNSAVAKYCWAQALVLAVMGVLFHQSTGVLVSMALAYCLCYVLVYRHLARLRKNAA